VKIVNHKGEEFAKGITNFSHDEMNAIKGKKSSQIAEVLGNRDYDEVVHRDNLIIIE